MVGPFPNFLPVALHLSAGDALVDRPRQLLNIFCNRTPCITKGFSTQAPAEFGPKAREFVIIILTLGCIGKGGEFQLVIRRR